MRLSIEAAVCCTYEALADKFVIYDIGLWAMNILDMTYT